MAQIRRPVLCPAGAGCVTADEIQAYLTGASFLLSSSHGPAPHCHSSPVGCAGQVFVSVESGLT